MTISNLRRTKLEGWYEYYRETCPVCHKKGGCMINEKGDAVVCIREESNVVFSRDLQSWVHRLNEKKIIDTSKLGPSFKTHKKAPPSILDFVYRALLESTTLSDMHFHHLTSASRGMSQTELAIRNYRSFPAKPWETVKEITNSLGYRQFPGVPGFHRNQYGWTISGMEGILIPYRSHYNEIFGFQVRVDNPKNDVEINKGNIDYLNARVIQPNIVQAYVNGEMIWEKKMDIGQVEQVVSEDGVGTVELVKGQRYFWLSSANKEEGTGAGDPLPVHIAVPTEKLQNWEKGKLHRTDTVWITEGALKADIAAEHIPNVYAAEELEKIGTTFVATPGVNTWRTMMPILEEMGVKHVNIALDMDVMSNPNVEYYLKEMISELKNKNYTANLALWNEKDGKGIDDVLINRRFPQLRKLF